MLPTPMLPNVRSEVIDQVPPVSDPRPKALVEFAPKTTEPVVTWVPPDSINVPSFNAP